MRGVTTLGLAVLRLLAERSQHPYELQQQLRDQGLDRIVKVTHGALYHTVDTLAKDELITPVETTRAGKRPARTVYSITGEGRRVAGERLRELLTTTSSDYPVYCAALALMSLLDPGDAADRLDSRRVRLESELDASNAAYDALVARGVPLIDLVEVRHVQAHLRADIDLTRALVEEVRDGRLRWPTSDTEGKTEQRARECTS
ncbi:PadR family transcriptional regulator [Actinosynnema pretiosum]|uniref:PadR family transcriptional regulator n=1 Tax=Actinosynnema pretiosum TaxID=42197 RepID=A0A290Z698_9PSEU|nr:PadR family transcriptional regulator [Actinosynnema pretiosum]ATE54502.1 PadR family transcriptional regulator [Actinosynnema pretiosum]